MSRWTEFLLTVVAVVVTALALGCGSDFPGPSAPSAVPTYTVSGIVRDSSSTLAVEGVQVQLIAGPVSGMSASTNTAGEFSLSAVPSGGITLRATKDGYVAVDRTFTISANTSVDVLLIPSATTLPTPSPAPAPAPVPSPSPSPNPAPAPAPAPSPAPIPSPSPSPSSSPSRSPAPSTSGYRYSGVLLDGLGQPVVGARVVNNGSDGPFLSHSILTTDSSGRWVIYRGSATGFAVKFRKDGYEERGLSGFEERDDFSGRIRRIVSVSCGVPTPLRVGWDRDYQSTARFDNGESHRGTANFRAVQSPVAGDTARLKLNELHVEALAVGTMTVYCTFFDVRSPTKVITVNP